MPRPLRLLASVLRVDQRWGMFASPNLLDGWFIMPAELANGTRVDLITEKAATMEKPRDMNAWYPGYRVKHYMTYLRSQPDSEAWRWLARYFCRRWNAAHPDSESVKRMQVILVSELVHNGDRRPLLMCDRIEEKPVSTFGD